MTQPKTRVIRLEKLSGLHLGGKKPSDLDGCWIPENEFVISVRNDEVHTIKRKDGLIIGRTYKCVDTNLSEQEWAGGALIIKDTYSYHPKSLFQTDTDDPFYENISNILKCAEQGRP